MTGSGRGKEAGRKPASPSRFRRWIPPKLSRGQRWVPPKPASLERFERPDEELEDWAKGLHKKKRAFRSGLLGNALLLVLLVGVPFARGAKRAEDTRRAYAEFAACLYGGNAKAEPGLVPDPDEAPHFATQLVAAARGWPARCLPLLDATAQVEATFVLPSVKGAEQRVRESVALVRGELASVGRRARFAALPHRPLRALDMLRSAVASQVESAMPFDGAVQSAVDFEGTEALSEPARLPVYAAPDAALSMWGDDQTLQVLALDRTGLSYLKAEPLRPFVRARLVRPGLLRGLHAQEGAHWLVWATAEARCAERISGCYGKTTGIAPAAPPLLELPVPRQLAAHLAGRPDRSLLVLGDRVWMASATAEKQVAIRRFSVPPELPGRDDLPPLYAVESWEAPTDSVLLLPMRPPLVLGTQRGDEQAALVRLRADERSVMSELAGTGDPWLTGCVHGESAGFVFGRAERLQVGALRRNLEGRFESLLWEPVSAQTRDVIHAHDPGRDQVVQLCRDGGSLVIARDATRQLLAIACRGGEARCKLARLAEAVDSFAVQATQDGALLAYAGGEEAPQIRVRALSFPMLQAGPETVPAACWDHGQGMCGRPTLARLGRRLVLAAHERTDLAVSESADEGKTWNPPPVL